jgi:hypothetical protein
MAKITNFKPKLSDQSTPYEDGKTNVQDQIEIVNSINSLYDTIVLQNQAIASLQAQIDALQGNTNPNPIITNLVASTQLTPQTQFN